MGYYTDFFLLILVTRPKIDYMNLKKLRFNPKIVLIVILLLASFLRLYGLNKVPVSLFGDELDVGYHAYNILKTGRDYSGNFMPLHFQSLAEWRTPLYLYSAVPTVAMFGITPYGVRLPAAIFGILCIWGMYLMVKEILLFGSVKTQSAEAISLLAALLLTVSPWHLQYSRAAFEVTMLLAFYLFGIYFFFRFLNNKVKPLNLYVSLILLLLTPLIYSTAKLFTPMLLLLLLLVCFKEIVRFSKTVIFKSIFIGLLVGLPVAYATLFSGGAQRFGYISIFTDPTRETQIGVLREQMARFRGEEGVGLQPTFVDRLFYNKYVYVAEQISNNYLASFSTEFLFFHGDTNLRHSIQGVGQFCRIEAVAILLGIILFFYGFKSRRVRVFIAAWILLGVIPSSFTRDGGTHATRLIIILPPLIFLISYGLIDMYRRLNSPLKYVLAVIYGLIFITNFIFYQKNYWTENPWYSERWWHAGYKEAIESVKEIEHNYDKVLISMANEPAWIFFGAYYQYDPVRWQETKPDKNEINDPVYGKSTGIDKFLFRSPEGKMDKWGLQMEGGTLFLASEKEVVVDLEKHPENIPGDLNLVKSIRYPSGLPAFYLFEKKQESN